MDQPPWCALLCEGLTIFEEAESGKGRHRCEPMKLTENLTPGKIISHIPDRSRPLRKWGKNATSGQNHDPSVSAVCPSGIIGNWEGYLLFLRSIIHSPRWTLCVLVFQTARHRFAFEPVLAFLDAFVLLEVQVHCCAGWGRDLLCPVVSCWSLTQYFKSICILLHNTWAADSSMKTLKRYHYLEEIWVSFFSPVSLPPAPRF